LAEIKLCILDLDDTLINTHHLYQERRHYFALEMYKMGVEYEEAYETLQKIDKEAVSRSGVDIKRFPLSFYETYKFLCKKHKLPFVERIGRELQQQAAEVFNNRSTVYPYTIGILTQLLKEGRELCVLTRGDRHIQMRRVIESELTPFFSNVFVVSKKTPEYFHKICLFYGVSSAEAVMVGNSMCGDILPALEAGLFGILVPNGTKEIEALHQPPVGMHAGRFFSGHNLTDVPQLLYRIENDDS